MRYFKDLLKILAYIGIFYVPLAGYMMFRQIDELNVQRAQASVQKLRQTEAKLTELLKDNQLLEACQLMEAQQSAGLIGVYVIHAKEASCHFPEGMSVLPPTKSIGSIEEFSVREQNLTFLRQITGDTEWAIAVVKPVRANLWTYLVEEDLFRKAVLSDIALVLYTIVVLIFLAVLVLAKSIQNEFRKKGKDPWWLTLLNKTFGKLQLHDLTILQRATQAFSQYADDLKKDNDLLETSLESSILQEIKTSHLQIPYSFEGAVAKVDINGFSRIVGEGHNANAFRMMDSLEEFGCELLRRYEGLFDKTVGDEIVAVFKKADGLLLAAGFARDLMSEFAKIEFAIGTDIRKFTLKSSISLSEITFRKRHSGYGFDGEALTRTTRLLEAVTVKDRNVLCCGTSLSERLSKLALIPSEQRPLEFKNMPPQTGVFIDQFMTIDKVYEMRTEDLKYFRSDSHILFLLQKIVDEKDLGRLDQVVNHLKTLKIKQCANEITSRWQKCVQHLSQLSANDPSTRNLLSKVIKLAENLIPQSQWDETCTQVLLNVPRQLEDRVNSSVIEVLIQKGIPNQILEIEESLMNMSSANAFRAKGNVLTARALHHLNSRVLSDLSKMVSSKNKFERHTGIFCACEVILYYRTKNPAELETYPKYSEVVQKLNHIRASDPEISDRLKGFLNQI